MEEAPAPAPAPNAEPEDENTSFNKAWGDNDDGDNGVGSLDLNAFY
jgi:hypothetical protein